MAIAVSELVANQSGSNASSYPTASISPTANALILAYIQTSSGSTAPTATLSGNGLTWVDIGNVLFATNTRRLHLFRAMGSSPSSGAVTISAASSTHCGWKIFEMTGVDTTGTNGSGAVVQVVVGTASGTATPSVTLAAFADAVNNAAVGGFASNAATTFTAGLTNAIGAKVDITSPVSTLGAEWQIGEDTSVDCTFGSSVASVGIALEVKAAGGGGGVSIPKFVQHYRNQGIM